MFFKILKVGSAILVGFILLVLGHISLDVGGKIVGSILLVLLSASVGLVLLKLTKNYMYNFIVSMSLSIIIVLMAGYVIILEPNSILDDEKIIVFMISFLGVNIPCIINKFIFSEKINFDKYLRYLIVSFSLSYLTIMSYLLFFSRRIFLFTEVNLQPFKTIGPYILGSVHANAYVIVRNLLGNVILFIPLGLIIGILLKNKYTKMLALLFIPIGIEAIQYLSETGVSDIDDVILNFLGGLIGWGMLSLIESLYARFNQMEDKSMFEGVFHG